MGGGKGPGTGAYRQASSDPRVGQPPSAGGSAQCNLSHSSVTARQNLMLSPREKQTIQKRTCHENSDERGSERAAARRMQTMISPSWGLVTPSKSMTSFFLAFPMSCTSSPRMHSPRALSEPRSREPKPTPNCRTVKRPPHATAASIEALVPDCAMMPRLPTHSYLVMPMPKSSVVMTRPAMSCRTVKQPPHATAASIEASVTQPPPAASASIEALVPDCAMMPKLLANSYSVMPMPKSSMVMTKPAVSGTIHLKKFRRASMLSASERNS
mmetsp:Transcript_72281/g.234732  ORF Transcript_72281/g.234732 Transcript_72281/m.234732 type:complete len:270 (-) Transcript_72281:255-1064(-)